jgi:hypothetical protein
MAEYVTASELRYLICHFVSFRHSDIVAISWAWCATLDGSAPFTVFSFPKYLYFNTCSAVLYSISNLHHVFFFTVRTFVLYADIFV